jgi:hypothetical protein
MDNPDALGAYGTPGEAALVDSILWWGVMSSGVIAIGMAIRIYKLGEDLTRRAANRKDVKLRRGSPVQPAVAADGAMRHR